MENVLNRIEENVARVMVGQKKTCRLLLASLLAGGHVLLEDVPGMGKTVMARALAKSIDGSFGRIQFTPDLLPSDVTGLSFFDQRQGSFVFQPGPVFCNLLLADEINRATPRTQSSLLECMAEFQVTVDNVTRPLEKPFFVIATQNPVETLGTYPLPEAQLDRFLMRISMEPPTREEEIAILNRFRTEEPLEDLAPVCSCRDLPELQKKAKEIFVHPAMMGYMADLAQASRNFRNVELGVSPRGTLALMRASQAWALLEDRGYVVPEDVKAVAKWVLAHRLSVSGGVNSTQEQYSLVEEMLESTAVPTEDWTK